MAFMEFFASSGVIWPYPGSKEFAILGAPVPCAHPSSKTLNLKERHHD